MSHPQISLPAVHLCIVQPVGYVHSLGFLDQARFFRHQFRRMGAEVSLAKNRLRHDAVNFVFGAHLGFDASLARRSSCVFVNLEQLGAGGAQVSPDYIKLLGQSAVVDYDAANVAAYTTHAEDVPIISFAHAPYLHAAGGLPLEERPIDVLFFGSLNERRKKLIERIEAAGRTVSTFNGPLYGPERDAVVRQAKAVFNCHYYDSARFEQARAFQCLSLGTPVISERGSAAQVPAAFEDGVFWCAPEQLGDFFAREFATPAFFAAARDKLVRFTQHDVIEDYAEALAFAAGYAHMHASQRTERGDTVWKPTRLHIGSGKDYKPGWFNVDVLATAQPDALLDLSQELPLPCRMASDTVGTVELHPGQFETVYANNVLEHVGDLPRLMTNCLALLADGGRMVIEVPYEHAPTAWQDPTHVRALNENSWLYYTDWFWYLGWFEYRFEVATSGWLDLKLQPCAQAQAAFMKLTLRKVATTPRERTVARALRADFGGVPDDDFWAAAAQDDPVDAPLAEPAAGSGCLPAVQAADALPSLA